MEALVIPLLHLVSAFFGAGVGFKQLNKPDAAEHMFLTAGVISFGVVLIKVYS